MNLIFPISKVGFLPTAPFTKLKKRCENYDSIQSLAETKKWQATLWRKKVTLDSNATEHK